MAPLQPRPGHFGLILPLCTSSATIGLALFQYPVFLSFLQQPNQGIAGAPLSAWLKPVTHQGGLLITALGLTSSLAGAGAARWLRTHATLETTSVSTWYLYGSLLAAAHSLTTAYLVFNPVRRIVQSGAVAGQSPAALESANRQEMQSWLVVHTARTLLLDLPALWCFAEGAALSFWII